MNEAVTMADLTVPTAPPLANIRNVELIRAGTWAISTGTWTATSEDLAAAIAAMSCPAVRRPILKLGHTDPRFDGEPAVGWIDNMATADDGSTLLGDYVGMPGWLGDVIASAYPDRSIEGVYDFHCQVGHSHPFVLTGVALLGVTPPGVGNLASLQDVATLYGVAASADGIGTPVATIVTAAQPVMAAAEAPTGAMVALIPSDADAARLAVDGGEPVGELHVTLLYLGNAADWDTAAREAVVGAIRQVAAGTEPLEVDGFALSVFNASNDDRDTCIVLGLSGAGLDTIHDAVTGAVTGPVPEQHTPWQPHVTLTFTDDLAVLADLVDRTGPVTFDRLRVAFAGEHTDIPLGQSDDAPVQAAGERNPMPSPKPTMVAANVSTEDIRREYYDHAGYSYWITEFHLDPLQLIVCDDDTGKHFRVAVTISGDSFAFGDPVEVSVEYVDKPATALVSASSRLVFASRAESRPGDKPKASEPPPVTPPPADAVVTDPLTPPATPAPDLPAAEPEPTTDPKEDLVSNLSEFRSRLGLDETADETAMLAALDALRVKAETPAEPTPEMVAASAKAEDEKTELRKEVTVLASRVQSMSTELAATKAEKAATVKASVLDAALKQGKFAPAEQEQWEKDYDEAPGAITRVLASIRPGTAVPVNASGITTPGEPTVDTDAEFEEMVARLDGPTARKVA